MEIKKNIAIMYLVGALTLGVIIGAFGSHYYFVTKPYQEAVKEGQQRQEELNKMVRHGQVLAVTPNQLTISVTESGDDKYTGQELTVEVSDRTTLQMGELMLNKSQVDVIQELKVGMEVDLLVSGNSAVAIYWEPVNLEQ